MSEKRNNPVLETLSPADRARFLNMVKKGISRRDFMHYMMAAGATAAASGTLFTGVSDAWANTPKRGGRVVFAGDQHGPNDTLDPAGSSVSFGPCWSPANTTRPPRFGVLAQASETPVNSVPEAAAVAPAAIM